MQLAIGLLPLNGAGTNTNRKCRPAIRKSNGIVCISQSLNENNKQERFIRTTEQSWMKALAARDCLKESSNLARTNLEFALKSSPFNHLGRSNNPLNSLGLPKVNAVRIGMPSDMAKRLAVGQNKLAG